MDTEHLHSKYSIIVSEEKLLYIHFYSSQNIHSWKYLVSIIKDNPVFVWNLCKLNETWMFSSGVGLSFYIIKKKTQNLRSSIKQDGCTLSLTFEYIGCALN